MSAAPTALIGPWTIDLVLVAGTARTGAERRSISRDVERGLLLRVLPGVYVDRAQYGAMSPEDQHVVRMRAIVAARSGCVLFSHWSAAVLHGLPVLRSRLGAVHITIEEDDDRHRVGVSGHRFDVDDSEVVRFGEILATGVGRTVVDLAGASPFEEGVMAADGALAAGVPRHLLDLAVDLVGERRASRRIGDVVGFAHPGGESAAESRMRSSLMRLGVEVPVLQHRLVLPDGSSAYLDALLPTARVGIEVDGESKYRQAAAMAEVMLAEKRREDQVRLQLHSLIRPGWTQSGSPAAMRTLLGRVGVLPTRPHTSMADYVAAARNARPRVVTDRPRWRT